MVDDGPGIDFGCERCWPSTSDAAWEARRTLTRESDLIDDLHFRVMILMCPHCNQRFVSVFTEMVDWVDSDDSQYWILLPITEAEFGDLVQQGDSLTETTLNTLGPGRRCLKRDYPKSAAAAYISWGTGISVGPHD